MAEDGDSLLREVQEELGLRPEDLVLGARSVEATFSFSPRDVHSGPD